MSPTPRNNDEPAATERAAPPAPRPKRRAARSATSRKPKGKAGDQSTRRRVRVAEGVYKDRHGLAATVKVNGIQRELRFPAGTPLKTIRARRDELRASLRTLPAGEQHTLAHDAERYLQQVGNELVRARGPQLPGYRGQRRVDGAHPRRRLLDPRQPRRPPPAHGPPIRDPDRRRPRRQARRTGHRGRLADRQRQPQQGHLATRPWPRDTEIVGEVKWAARTFA